MAEEGDARRRTVVMVSIPVGVGGSTRSAVNLLTYLEGAARRVVVGPPGGRVVDLIEAGVIKGRKCTSYHSIKTDVINAGGQWRDETVVTDQGLITSRNPGDLEAFSAKIIEEIGEGRHERRAVA